ncbi:lamin tail domain-containing protein 2 isoform X2 [Tamandua tetradactyla]|uniref:lamin tail domain-containing protein 2 isoform X2 n=1 Tax=Tamandua tetradactyla TaxID=48850 RepID=UPI0040548766
MPREPWEGGTAGGLEGPAGIPTHWSWGSFGPTTPTTSRMVKPYQDTAGTKEEAHSSQVDCEQVSGDLGPPAGADLGVPTVPQDTKPQATPALIFANQQLAPEFLDPRTLRLLWGQRELELQALRWAVQGNRDGRHSYILQEVAGRPPERSSHGWDREKLLQNQVHKLTLELKEEKERAQLEKERWEKRLLQATNTLQQLEAELQTFQKSCLLQLAHSSWVGRVLRSQTGSVEVVTADTLVIPSDSSENELLPTAQEAFRLEDVDWNSIAQRYPNLLTRVDSEHKQSGQGSWNSEAPRKRAGRQQKSVEWSSLPGARSSSSAGSSSDAGGCPLAQPSLVRQVTGHPPQGPEGSSQEQVDAQTQTFSGDTTTGLEGLLYQDRCNPLGAPCKISVVPRPYGRDERWGATQWPGRRHSGSLDTLCPTPPRASPAGSYLKIVAVSSREKLVRVLNQSLEETADLGGSVLQQLERDFPVRRYRFPPGTLLPPRHHVTVWGEGTGSTRKHRSPLRRESVCFSSRCVTLLLNSEGEAPQCATPVWSISAENTDLSIDRFPLSEAGPRVDEQRNGPRPSRKRKARAARPERARPRTRTFLPLLSANKLLQPREAWARPDGAETENLEPLPAIPEVGPGLDGRQARKEHAVQVCRRGVDRGCPMVALSVQSTAESRFGFRFLSCAPITAGPCARL